MSSIPNLQNGDFITVRSRRKKGSKCRTKATAHQTGYVHDDDDYTFDHDSVLKTLTCYKEDIQSSDLYCSVLASVNEGLKLLGDVRVGRIVCLGLGHVGERVIARYQLALLLCLRDNFRCEVSVQDPAFSRCEREFLATLQLTVLQGNLEGKVRADVDTVTLFYLPHCAKQLTNNLLWKNWGLELRNCVLVCNSFANVVESTPRRLLLEKCEYLARVSDCAIELAVINTFKYYEVFNDTAVHVFPLEKLILRPEDFWKSCEEPVYKPDDCLEFIPDRQPLSKTCPPT